MASALGKDIRRSIAKSLGRFLAIAGIVALGTGFYAGLRMTAPDMYLASDGFYDANSFMDLRVVSTLGLTDDDVQALRETEGVDHVMPAYETDIVGTINDEQYSIRVHSLNPSALTSDIGDGMQVISDNPDYLNRVILTDGRWPTARGECVISADRVMNEPTHIGDTIVITQCTQDLEDTLKTDTYTIVGYVNTPYYVCSSNLGTTSLGSGTLEQYMFVPETDFADDLPYTELFVTFTGARELQNTSPEYSATTSRMTEVLEGVGEKEAARRTAEIKKEAQDELDEKRAEFNTERDNAMAELADAKAQLDATASVLWSGQQELRANEAAYQRKLEEYNTAVSQGTAAFESRLRELQEAKARLEDENGAPIPQYLDQYTQIIAGLQQLQDESAAAAAQNAAAKQALADAAAQLDSARAQLAQGQAQYDSGLSQYYAAYDDTMAQLAEAEQKLDDAQADIDAIDPAEWYLLDRTKNIGVESFKSDAGRVDSIARVFPFIFFLVAALVALTTMTRMVDEERVLIGTYKALGYSTAKIASKYLAYAAIASVAGSVVGIAILSQVLPTVIMDAYAIIYTVPNTSHPIDIPISLLSAGLGIGITLLATWGAVVTTLRERPAALMLPRAPKAGKRILLERIAPLWARTSFSWKVTFRNLFRYKKRLLMTIIGIAGCTALLLTGLGLRNAINDIIDNHFGRIVQYNAIVSVADDQSPEDRSRVEALLTPDEEVSAFIWTKTESMLAIPEGSPNIVTTLIVPSDTVAFDDFIVLKNRVTGEPCSLGEDGAVVTEKLASVLGIGVGDTIALHEQDVIGNASDNVYEMQVTGIAENYVLNYVYVSPDTYQRVWGEPPTYSTALISMTTDEAARASWSDRLRDISDVRTVGFNDETIETYRTMLKSVDLIVVVLVIAAAALAFIVLYNLTNINITERKREIASLKVLGFTRREVQSYIYREIILLSIIGAAIGLVFGTFLEDFIIVTAEVDQVMFGRVIHPESFAMAFILTLVFTVFVMFVMRRKLNRVNMVESLKSVD